LPATLRSRNCSATAVMSRQLRPDPWFERSVGNERYQQRQIWREALLRLRGKAAEALHACIWRAAEVGERESYRLVKVTPLPGDHYAVGPVGKKFG
jgi:hypothetical protein